MEPEKNFLDHLAVLVRWRRMILFTCITVSVVTAGISLIITPVYRASAVLFPPSESQGTLGISAILEKLPVGMLGIGESVVSATEFVPILKSQRVAEAIIRRFSLQETYDAETREELLQMVADRLEVELSREQFLTVSYEAESPESAAEITNAFVEELDTALRHRREQQARDLRSYLEKRLAQAERGMIEAETAYNAFQKEHSAIDIESQTKAQIDAYSSLITSTLGEMVIRREIAALQMNPDNSRVRQLDIEIEGAREALDGILTGSEPDSGRGVPDMPSIMLPMDRIPDLGLQAMRLMREMEIRNLIYQFVLQEYEKSSFEEKKETSLVVVLDPAVPPDFRSRPRRALMVGTAAGLSLLLSILVAFLMEALRSPAPENRSRLDAIRQEFRSPKTRRE
ncbi:MAG: Wzz/FepE/Etk N-terminal domain-containing protein [Gemmatimonadota bacterium]|nr:Wzz/FepE/Etk N-terminal domain-containing protein [Gemmatimonadota bacterium]